MRVDLKEGYKSCGRIVWVGVGDIGVEVDRDGDSNRRLDLD